MDPRRKRKIRLVVALGVAVVLAAALVYTSFSAANGAKQPSQIVNAQTEAQYDITGEVVRGSIRHQGKQIAFELVDRDGSGPKLPVVYEGTVPDPFRGGREIVLTGHLAEGTFVGDPDTLITKCPSKFKAEDGK
ncbi:MAG: cytochrome c maturation protein CcmE [Solirubrobacterales bacterium]